MVTLSMEMVQQVLLERGMHGHTYLQALNLMCLLNDDDDRVNLTHVWEEFVRALAVARSGTDAPPARAVPPLKLLLTTTSAIPLQLAAFVPPAETLLQTPAMPLNSALIAAAIADDEALDIATALPWPADESQVLGDLISANTTARADQFIADAVGRLRALPFSEFLGWPEYPGVSSFDHRIPADLSQYVFTLTKDTLPGGEIRIALQRRPRYQRRGNRNTSVDGFVVALSGTSRALKQQEVWYLS